jgi:hypothetical protein
MGVALVNAGGCDQIYGRAHAFQRLGYPVSVLRDDDKQPDAEAEREFQDKGGSLFKWGPGRSTEHELFLSLPDADVLMLIDRAIELHGRELLQTQVLSVSNGKTTLESCLASLSQANPGAVINHEKQFMV